MRIHETRLAGLCGLVLMSACSPRAPAAKPAPAPVAEAMPVSALKSAPEFAACAWQEVKGGKLALQAFACGPEQGGVHIEADDGLPGFQLVYAGPPAERRPVIRTFAKAADAPLEAILPGVRAASPGAQTATCAFAPAQGYDDKDKGRYVLQPTGAAKTAWEASEARGEPQEAPCGPLGVSVVGDRYFKVMPGHPDIVVYADMGSEIQIFDPETLRVIAP
ncbi:hypothetical protein JKL49_20080 [Phenylobacterium sp. 20VBR1]|uniref:Lipoprotein n=1 Tax=Phenylobacterium glaciei TaxID=2803784 RepID=A0A941D674_9CAUL|nr:hypothetical protein [Phenylobacterium glaciei]MBR7621701.1 hypothetical protein [Phenylobacterium glaciei]